MPWLLALAAYFLFPDRMTFGSQVLIMVMFALSLDLILGYAGIVTLGHAAFFGIGAYTVGLLAARLGWSEPITGLIAAALVAGLVGFITGWFLLRYRGLTLLMLTLATAIMLQETGNLRSDISGGYDGLPGLTIAPLFGVFQYDLYGHVNYLYVLAVLAVIFFFVRRIVYSPFGQALTGIRENVRRMHAIGSPVHRRLVTVYTIAAAIAGVAGALFTQTNAYVTLDRVRLRRLRQGDGDADPRRHRAALRRLRRRGGLHGAGGLFLQALPTFWQFGIGLLLVLAVLFARRGLLGLIEDAGRYFARRQAMSVAALQVQGLNRAFGALPVTRDVDLTLEKGARRALIGPNGAGKTTLVNLITGALKPQSGRVLLDGEDITADRPGRARAPRAGAHLPDQPIVPRPAGAAKMSGMAISERDGHGNNMWRPVGVERA